MVCCTYYIKLVRGPSFVVLHIHISSRQGWSVSYLLLTDVVRPSRYGRNNTNALTFSTVEGNIKHIKDPVKYVEVQHINPASIDSFKNSIASFDLLLQLDLNDRANPNVNYNILSSVLEQAKNRHLPKKIQRFDRRRHCIEPWMNRELLSLVNKKNDKYRDWKSTNNDFEYELKKNNFKTLERIVKENIKVAKREYYFKTFTAQKMI